MNHKPIYLHNTLTKNLEEFKPSLPHHVSMYHCGPTVYNFVHIGNLRAFIATDILRRIFEQNGYQVTQVMNITDIGHLQSDEDDGEDKMTLAIKRENLPLNQESMKVIALRYYDAFRSDIERVSILPAHTYPFASDHIVEDIRFVQKLIDTGYAYKAKDGIYFDTSRLKEYGKLGGLNIQESSNESRLGVDTVTQSGKRNFRDFAVWKFELDPNSPNGYDALFGRGFPGWHLECSVMSMKYLGDTFDIHTGGVDHIPVHHNNEIAQSEAISGQLLARYWLHNAHINIEGGKKMAKSGEQFITLDTLEERGISPLGFRFWLLGASYRSPLQFSYDALTQAEHTYRKLINRIADLIRDQNTITSASEDLEQYQAHKQVWMDRLLTDFNNDLGTAAALATIQTVLRDVNIDLELKLELTAFADQVFGLQLIQSAEALIDTPQIPETVLKLAQTRLDARKQKDWDRADTIKKEIIENGYEVIDTLDGFTLKKI